ncbi:hypothetical protein CS0771_45890 [Catellatospora sp. IY07-71]|uniref:hypothetical protein n=1 Tax=Catellatospora sp. IY07-71 TaxID=2728827 RepID=UPI001BB39226|nr:hypothetical protein [Catellatospora sp. IY07-71]BCJ75045.1 hypothetical protein CS0771_45890 [Catellatospora sp. IY07-71]
MSDRITVSVNDDHVTQIDDLAERLRTAGMRVDQVLSAAGMITGAVDQDRRASIAMVPGVAAVEDETSFQLPPPESDIQ